MSVVSQILISKFPTQPMQPAAEVLAVPGRGLEGDRYYDGRGTFSPQPQKADFELTLVEEERIEAFAREFDLDITAAHARRNVVTRGVDLNALVGREFRFRSRGEELVRGHFAAWVGGRRSLGNNFAGRTYWYRQSGWGRADSQHDFQAVLPKIVSATKCTGPWGCGGGIGCRGGIGGNAFRQRASEVGEISPEA